MSANNNSTLKIMALGRQFKIGMLYDFRSDELIPNILLWGSDKTPSNINCQALTMDRCEVHIIDTFIGKADMLGIDDNLKLSVFTGLVDVIGPDKLIYDQKTTNHIVRFILKRSITSHLSSLTMTYSSKEYTKHPEVFDQQIATHVVTDILYGADIFFIFDRKLSDYENSIDIQNHVKELLKKIGTVRILDNGQLNWKNDEKTLAETLTCQYYGDFQLETNPTTFEEAVKLYKQLPKFLMENNENIVPKQVWIYPLYLLDDLYLTQKRFHQISRNSLSKSLELIDSLDRLEITLNCLKNRFSSIQMFYRTKQELSKSITQIDKYEINVKKQMIELLSKVRGGSVEETALTNLDLFPLNERKLNDWIQFKSEEITIFTGFINDLRRQPNIKLLTCSFTEAQNNFNREFILRLIIHVTEKNDSFINELFQYSNHNTTKQIGQNIKFDCRFNQDNLTIIKKQIKLFIKFAKDNINKQNIKFIVNEEYAEDFHMKKGVTTILYQNGIPNDFEIPSKVGQPYATDVSGQSVTLSWLKPEYGSRSIQRYKIYGRNISDQQWKLLLTTTNAEQSAVISNLMIAKYQFKIQGITLVGDTDESDASNIIKIYIQIVINPPSDSVELYVREAGGTKKAMRMRPNSKGIVNLDDLEDANYEVEAYSISTEPPLLLHKFEIKKTQYGVDAHAVDLKATVLDIRFINSDVPFSGAAVLGTFTDLNGRSWNLNGNTENEGKITLVLPEGVIENLLAKKSEVVVKKQGKITLWSPLPTPADVPRKPKRIMIHLNSSSFSSVVEPDGPDSRVVVLGDVSGSMDTGTQMDLLRLSFEQIFDKCILKECKISLASWNTTAEWCTETWIHPNQKEHTKLWIKNRRAGDGTHMRNAIDDCMRRYPDATDVYVICDGDITPFSINGGESDWAQYRAKYLDTKFHFIAVGKTASHESMEAMANVGNGIFDEVT